MVNELSAPIDVQIEITQSCNQNCRHCYNFWRQINDKKLIHSKSLGKKKLEKIIQELVSNKVPSITITGGEPFLCRNDVFWLLETAQQEGIRTSINTNFSTVREDDIKRLAKFKVPILVTLLSSVAAKHEYLAGAATGTYENVIRNIKLAIHEGVSVSINMALVRKNLAEITSVAKVAKELGVQTFCATRVLPNSHTKGSSFLLSADEVLWSLEKLMEIEQAFRLPVEVLGCYPKCLFVGTKAYYRFFHRACVAGRTTVTIDPNGKVRPCPHVELFYGNILYEPFVDIWKRMSQWRHNEFIPQVCSECPILSYCNGGCRVNTSVLNLKNMDCHADAQRLANLSHKELSPSIILLDDSKLPIEVIVNPNTEFREEAFGSLVLCKDRWAIILLNKSATVFLEMKKAGKTSFSLTDFIQESKAVNDADKEKIKKLYKKLVQKGILIPPNTLNKTVILDTSNKVD